MKRILLALIFSLFSVVSYSYNVTYTGTFGSLTQITDISSAYETSFDSTLKNFADAFAVSNTSQPVFGEPYRNLAFGISISAATPEAPDPGKAGSVTMDDVYGASVGVFGTISLDPLDGIFGLGFFENSDFTVKLMKTPQIEYDDYEGKLWNLGLIFRKQLLSKGSIIPMIFSFEGIGFSFGYFLQRNELNEKISSTSLVERVYLEGGNYSEFSITGGHKYLEVDISSLDSELKFYFNFLGFLDIFFGGGLTYTFASDIYSNIEIQGEINVYDSSGTIVPGQTQTGSIIIDGNGSGSKWIPRAVVGGQINILMIKVPFQAAFTFGEGDKIGLALTTGVTLSF